MCFYETIMHIGFIVGIARLLKGLDCFMFLTMHSVFILLTVTFTHHYKCKCVEYLWHECLDIV
jgi:hypothetical protein